MTQCPLDSCPLTQRDAEINRVSEKYRQAVRALHLAVGPTEAVHWLRVAESE